MIVALKRCLRFLVPAWFYARITRHRRVRFAGPYRTWSDARAASTGYDTSTILDSMTAATRAVAAGRAAYERDTVLFYQPSPDPLLLAELKALGAVRPGGLRVLDFGGALGSTWFQHRSYLADLPPIAWHIVEQPLVALRGRTDFANPALTFHESLDSALALGMPDLVLLSSVLQYLETPWLVLERVASLPARGWLVSRTPFADTLASDAVVVQHVPPAIYAASYPAWVFSSGRFAAFWVARGAALSWHACSDGAYVAGPLAFSFRTALVRTPPDAP